PGSVRLISKANAWRSRLAVNVKPVQAVVQRKAGLLLLLTADNASRNLSPLSLLFFFTEVTMMSGKTLKSRATAETAAKSNTRKPQELAWYAIVIIGGFHITAAWVLLTTRFSLPMWAYVYVYGSLTLFGTTAGAHRLWTHRTYKAKFPLRVLLTFLHVSSAQHRAERGRKRDVTSRR
ncbi:hypothetical protein FOCC_FOCC010943, partial [Frankliniella occidentalis]